MLRTGRELCARLFRMAGAQLAPPQRIEHLFVHALFHQSRKEFAEGAVMASAEERILDQPDFASNRLRKRFAVTRKFSKIDLDHTTLRVDAGVLRKVEARIAKAIFPARMLQSDEFSDRSSFLPA